MSQRVTGRSWSLAAVVTPHALSYRPPSDMSQGESKPTEGRGWGTGRTKNIHTPFIQPQTSDLSLKYTYRPPRLKFQFF